MGIVNRESPPQEETPKPEHIAGISLWQQFEQLDERAKREIFPDLVRALHHSSIQGLDDDQLRINEALYEELLHDTRSQIESAERLSEPVDRGHDR